MTNSRKGTASGGAKKTAAKKASPRKSAAKKASPKPKAAAKARDVQEVRPAPLKGPAESFQNPNF